MVTRQKTSSIDSGAQILGAVEFLRLGMVIKEIAANDNSDDDAPPGAAAPNLQFPRQECLKDEAEDWAAMLRQGPPRFAQKRLAIITKAKFQFAPCYHDANVLPGRANPRRLRRALQDRHKLGFAVASSKLSRILVGPPRRHWSNRLDGPGQERTGQCRSWVAGLSKSGADNSSGPSAEATPGPPLTHSACASSWD